MIFHKTFLKVADNSGALFVRCVKVLKTKSNYGKSKKALVGDIILVSIRFYVPNKNIKKGNLYKALIIRTKSKIIKQIGNLFFDTNGIILLDKKMQPLGTKVFGPAAREIKLKKFNKLSTFIKAII